jgi:uncharacterized protein YjbI with pentapeptide repeats
LEKYLKNIVLIEASAMNKLRIFIILLAVSVFWYGCEGKSVIATTGSETSSDMPPTNFSGAALTGAKLSRVSLDGVILCNTTMPDGTINNSSCNN